MMRIPGSSGDALSAARLRGSCLPRALALAWKAAPALSSAYAALVVLRGILPVATVWLVRWLVDDLTAILASGRGWDAALSLMAPASLLGALMLLAEMARSAASWIRIAQAERLRDFMSDLVHERSAAVDLEFYDSPEFFDRLHRARDEASYRPVALVESAGGILEAAITTVALAAVLVPYGAALPLLLIASTAPALLVVLHYGFRHHRWRVETTADERRSWYYEWLLTSREAASELRLFGLGDRFRSEHRAIRGRLSRERIRLAREHAAAEAAAAGAGLLLAAGAMAWMVFRAIQGLVSLGDLALFYQAFSQGQSRTRTLLEELGQLYSNSLFLKGLFEFLDLKPAIVDPERPRPAPESPAEKICFSGVGFGFPGSNRPAPKPLAECIRFRGVGFSYPGSQRAALEDFSLFVPAGRVVAIVGENGAGKTTLTKLLCRLHDVGAGRIEIDGVDLREMPLADLRERISVLFQRPVRYNDSVANNIKLADPEPEASDRKTEEAIRAAGAGDLLRRLPGGTAALLGKTFTDGEEISEGEWQRIALARALYRDAPILVLDEPTSAMDPWAEIDWAERFACEVRGRTVIVITHRPVTAAAADEIHVMEAGRIVESGSHEELISRGGRYAQLWRQTPPAPREYRPEELTAASTS